MLNSRFRIPCIFVFNVVAFGLHAQKSAIASGNWTTPAIWSPAGAPTGTDNVIISAGNTVTITTNETCNNLQIGGVTPGQLVFGGAAARTFSILGDVQVAASGTFQVPTTSNATHSIVVRGNYTNLGTSNFNTDVNSLGTLIFNRNANATLSGSGPLTIYKITVDLGLSASNIFSLTAVSGTYASNFLTLNNGTFKLVTAQSLTLVPFTNSVSLPNSTGLWLNSPNAQMSFSALVQFAGKVTVENGYFDVGNATNEDLTSLGGTLCISGGTVDVAGKYDASTGANSYSMTGGQLILPSVSSTNATLSPFSMSGANSRFDMSSGVIIIRREGGSGLQDLGFVNTGVTSGAVTGGTLQIGNASTPATQTIGVNASYLLPHIVVNSANARMKLNVNSMTTMGDITINSGSLIANNLDITVPGNWTDAGGFNPGTGTVRFISGQPQTIQRTSTETFGNVIFSGGRKTITTALSVAGNFSVAASTTVDLSGTNYTLGVKGNLSNNGVLSLGTNSVVMNGTVTQQINGTSGYTFYDLVLNNLTGFVLNSTVSIKNTLNLNNGTFSVNTQSLTMLSDASGTARIPRITGSGALLGAITVQRFAPGGSTGWTTLGTPIRTGATFQDWDDDIYITCPTCPDGYGNFNSIYTYSEAVTGSLSSPGSYVPITSVADAMSAGKGYFVYLGTAMYSTADITLDMTGTVTTGNFPMPLQYHNSGSAADDGWNLISNPYPSPISWTALRNSSTRVDNAIYVYNPDLNSGTGGYASYVNGVSSPDPSAGGIGNDIPMGQGFMVHATNVVTLTATEVMKTAGTQALLKTMVHNPASVRIQITGPYGFSDECVLYEQKGASADFDKDFDAWEMQGQDIYAPRVFLRKDSVDFQINGVQPVSGTYTTDVALLSAYPGTYTLAALLTNLPEGYCIKLFDRFNNTYTDLRNDQLAFYFEDTTTVPRFVLSLVANEIPLADIVTQPNCQNAGGQLIVTPSATGACTYIWKDQSQQVIKSSTRNGSDTLNGLPGGHYILDIFQSQGCASATKQYQLNTPILPEAAFSLPAQVFSGLDFSAQDQSFNATTWSWSFGDGGHSNLQNGQHNYSQTGTYSITLVVSSSTGCRDSIQQTLHVDANTSTSITEIFEGGYRVKEIANRQFEIDLNNLVESGNWNLTSTDGKLIAQGQIEKQQPINLNLEQQSAGIYFVQIGNESRAIKLVAR